MKKFEYIILSFIIILGFVARLYKIGNPLADWHSWRQADTASVTRIFVQKGLNLLYPRYNDISSIQSGYFNPEGYRFVEFPIFNLVHYLLYESFPKISLEVWGRLVSIIASTISTFLMFLIGRKMAGRWAGILASFFFAFIPFNIYFTRVILPEPLAVTLALLSLWFFMKFLDEERGICFYTSALALSLSLLIKPYILFYALPIVYLANRKYGLRNILTRPKYLINLLIYTDIVLVPLLLWRGWISHFPEGIPFTVWAFNGDRIRFRPAFWRWIFAERIGNLILGIWGIVPLVFGIVSRKKNYLSLSLMAGAILYLTIVATASVRHDYYQIFVIPPICFLLAEGCIYLWNNKNFNQWISRPILIFSIFIMLGVGAYQVKEFYKINHPEIIAAGREVDKITPKDALVIAPYNGDTAFLYQTDRSGWPAIDDSIDQIIEKGADYYVSVDLGSSDTKLITSKYETVVKTSQFIIVNLHKPLKK